MICCTKSSLRFLVLFLVCAVLANAATLLDITDMLTSGSPTQTGRLFRTGVPSDWSSVKAFPGKSGTAAIHYQTYTMNVGPFPYIQIESDDPSALFFFSAYHISYNPADFSLRYLGDAGSSGNPFPGVLRYFQVVVPVNSDLVIVVNEVNPSAGLNSPFRFLVEGFLDTEYNDVIVPEPGTIALVGCALALLAWRGRSGAA